MNYHCSFCFTMFLCYSFCLTSLLLCVPLVQNYCSTLLVWRVVVFFLLNIVVVLPSFYLKLLFYSSYSTCYYVLRAWLVVFLLLFNVNVLLAWYWCSFVLHYYSTPLARPTILLLLLNVVVHLAQRCCFLLIHVPLYCSHDFVVLCSFCSTLQFLFLLFQIGTPPLFFVNVKELSKFKFFRPNLEGEIFIFNFCLLMNFLNYPYFWEMVVNNVFSCCV